MKITEDTPKFIADIAWNDQGLVPAIAQDAQSGKILMMAWMNKDALMLTVQEQKAVYWSRSRNTLWRKGESSGHEQVVKDIRLDCDNDVVLLLIQQQGGIACHTGRESCFYKQLKDMQWQAVEPVLRDPAIIYR